MEDPRKYLVQSLRPVFVFTGACALWVARMPLVEAYYQRTYDLHYYPINGDSREIPLFFETIFTFAAAPFLITFLWLVLRRVPQRCSWLAWNRERWLWSAFWTALFGVFFYGNMVFLLENVKIRLPLNAAANVGWALVWLELRAVVVSKLTPRKSPSAN